MAEGTLLFESEAPAEPHLCAMRGPGAPDAEQGSIFRCACGRHWYKTDGFGHYVDKWKPVRWYHFSYRSIIGSL